MGPFRAVPGRIPTPFANVKSVAATDAAVLEGVIGPMALGFRSGDIRRVLMVGEPQSL